MYNKTSTAYFHAAGWPFMAIFLAVTLLLAFIGPKSFFVGFLLTAWCFYFFRNPSRMTPTRPGLIISPADGKVIAIKDVIPDPEFDLGGSTYTRISIFLNVFDVHVNRIPAAGTILTRCYRPGKFVNASFDKASIDNERMALTIKLEGDHPMAGEKMTFVQIAGLVARRIICDVYEGQKVETGDRFGLIRFGSRADIYLPLGAQPLVVVGQYMIGGETVLADCASSEAARVGVIRA